MSRLELELQDARRNAQPHRNAMLACVVTALVVPLLGSLIYFVILEGHPAARWIYAAVKVFTVGWPALTVYGLEGEFRPSGRIRWRTHIRALPLGLLVGGFIGGMMILFYGFTPVGDYVSRFRGDILAKLTDLGIDGPLRYVVFGVFLSVLHSLIEEYYWRWYVFGRLARFTSVGWAYVLAGVGFAAHHYVVLGCFFSAWGTIVFGSCVGVGGAIWCWMLRRQGTLAGAWLSHALVDAAILVIGFDIVFRS